MTVLILGISNISNMGDDLIAETTDYLVKSINPGADICHRDAFLRWKQLLGFNRWLAFLLTAIRVFFEKTKLYLFSEWAFAAQHCVYYKSILKNANCCIVTTGMLKYSSQAHGYMYSVLCRIADEMNIPVLLNAKSIQPGNPRDKRYIRLKVAIHRKNIHINTRDGVDGVRILKEHYNIDNTSFVGDPALWAGEMQTIDNWKTTAEVGINLIRPSIYQDYGQIVSAERIIQLYWEMCDELTRRGHRWAFFCNGMEDDYSWATELINSNKGYSFTPPSTTKELIQTITSFNIIIGFRLHACITAVAFDVPVVGMIWDPKARFFAKSIGIDHFFVEPNQLEASHIVDLVEERLSVCSINNNKEMLKNKCKNAIAVFLELSEKRYRNER